MKNIKSLACGLAILFAVTILSSCGGSSNNGGGMAGSTEAATNFAYLGLWTGTWTNTTFGSSGSVSVNIVDNGNGTVAVTVDLGGFVGGLMDPDPRTDNVTINADGSANYSEIQDMLGELNVTLSDNGQLNISTPNIPTTGFDSFTTSGTVSATSVALTTNVIFTGGGSASGTVNATKN